MKNKVIVFLTVIVLIFTGATGVKADTPDIDDCINKTLEYEYKEAAVTDAQSFVNDGLMAVAGISPCEWWVINIKALYPETDFSEYVKAVEKYLDEAEDIKPTDYERIALAFYILGEKDDFIREVIKEQTGKMGIMSVIYGLMPAAYGGYDADYIADSLLKFQLPDGSFSVNQKAGDVDVTAMALQAMAPLREKYEEKINKALEYLNNNMTENGGYKSMGTENSESLAQVIMAKTALKDTENMDILINELITYQNEDGGFCHIKGGKSNSIATYQCMSALISYKNGFVYDKTNLTETGKDDTTVNTIKWQGKYIKYIVLSALGIVYAVFLVVFFIRKKKKKSVFMTFTIVFVGLAVYFSLSDFKTKDEYYDVKTSGEVVTYLEITGHGKEVILSEKEIDIKEGDSTFDQLLTASMIYEIPVDYNGSKVFSSIYVKAIAGMAEFDYGNMSGWTYSVNGEFPNVSCSAYKLSEGDYVRWIYTDDGKVGQ